jgi:ubiquinone biosynthesis protein
VRGIPIGDREKLLAAGHDLNAVLRKSAEAFFYQVFRDGFFHGDMHGGNAFVEESGCVVPVDFGIMGRVDADTRGYLAELLTAFLQRDYKAVAEVQFRAGFVASDKSLDVFAQACRSIGEPIFGKPSNQISVARLLAQLLRVTEQFEMQVQPQLLLLQKTMLMAEGMGTKLNADVNIWELARPLIEDWMQTHFGPRARLERAVGETLEAARKLPRLVDTLEKIAERERRRAEQELAVPAAPEPRRARADWALLLAAVALAAALAALWG